MIVIAVTALWKVGNNLNGTLKYVENKVKTKLGDYKLNDLKNTLDYAENKDKTEEMYYVSSINCSTKNAYEEMMITKNTFGKSDGIQAFHGYQSFKEGEVTPEEAHNIGIELAKEMWGDKYEVVITTHLNTNHIHNHFVVNSVSFVDGKRYRNTNKNIAELRRLNDDICLEHGLSVIEEKETKRHINFKDYQINHDNYYTQTKRDLDLAIKKSKTYDEFIHILKDLDYEVTYRAGKISIKGKNYKRNIRIERYFGEQYSIDNIKKRIEIEDMNSYSYLDEIIKYHKKVSKERKKYHGLIGLYRYYCYLLKVYPTNIKKHHLSYDMRKEVVNMDKLSNDIVFMDKYKIDSEEKLSSLKDNLISKKEELLSSKKHLRYLYNKNKDDSLLTKIDEVNNELNKLRKDLNTCSDIEKRTSTISNQIKEYEGREKYYERVK